MKHKKDEFISVKLKAKKKMFGKLKKGDTSSSSECEGEESYSCESDCDDEESHSFSSENEDEEDQECNSDE